MNVNYENSKEAISAKLLQLDKALKKRAKPSVRGKRRDLSKYKEIFRRKIRIAGKIDTKPT